MTWTYDPTAPNGQVRLTISDTQETTPIYSDEEISAFLTMENNSVLRASARALESIAVNQALTLKVIKLLQLATDGAKLAETLLKLAKNYRDQAEFTDAAGGLLFDWAEFVDEPFAANERLTKQLLR
jgi:hypothetical protein